MAHPFGDRARIRELELAFEAKYPTVELVNPFYDVANRPEIKEMDKNGADSTERSFQIDILQRKLGDGYANTVVERDLAAIDDCDAVLAFVTGTYSIGTFMEIHYAAEHYKLVYIIIEHESERGHPWLQYFSTKCFGSFAEFEAYFE